VANRPTDAAELREHVAAALADRTPLRLHGGRSKDGLGHRPAGPRLLDLSGLDGIVSYEPDELLLVVRPGTRLSQLETLLAEHDQHIPCEIPHWGEAATIGGAIACNLSGPRRFKAGALRDFVLGIELVDGHGRLVRAGGKVVKNVTGYDLSKVLCGSFGTLGALSEVCLKVWPRPQAQGTLVQRGRVDAILEQLRHLAGRPWEITGLACQPCQSSSAASQTAAYIRIEGPAPAVKAQLESLQNHLKGESEILADAESAAWWRAWRELETLEPTSDQRLWRFFQPAAEAETVLEQLRGQGAGRYGCDWAGALVWALMPADANAQTLHQIAAHHGGSAWRLAAGEENLQAFTPLDPGTSRLNAELKRAFDPEGIFDPLRLCPSP
jgi:glycolate oxidase FAD binding subunit